MERHQKTLPQYGQPILFQQPVVFTTLKWKSSVKGEMGKDLNSHGYENNNFHTTLLL